ncbi:hypothetical protein D3C75_847430 [compost metagenome]
MQQAADFRVSQQHELVLRIKADTFVFFAAVLFIRLKSQEFHVVRLIALLLGERIFGQLKAAVNLVFQPQQGVDARAAESDDQDRVVDRVYSDFVADDPPAK